MFPAESHIKYVFSLIYIGKCERKDVYNLSAKLFVTKEPEVKRY